MLYPHTSHFTSICPPSQAPEKDEGIPKFWLGVLSQSAFSQHFGEDDLPVLEHLTNMTATYSEDFKSFTLHMHFSENPFFSNAVLTKTYTFDTNVFAEDPNLQGAVLGLQLTGAVRPLLLPFNLPPTQRPS